MISLVYYLIPTIVGWLSLRGENLRYYYVVGLILDLRSFGESIES